MLAGGRIVIEAGGHGNIAGFLEVLGAVRHYDGSRFWNFADIGETSERLHKAGFREIAVRLVPDETRLQIETTRAPTMGL